MNLDDIFKCISCKEKFEHRYCSENDVAYCHSCYQWINDEHLSELENENETI